jgi:hypothetical protein
MGPTAALVLPEGEAGASAGRLGYDQLSRALAQHTATSKEALLVSWGACVDRDRVCVAS